MQRVTKRSSTFQSNPPLLGARRPRARISRAAVLIAVLFSPFILAVAPPAPTHADTPPQQTAAFVRHAPVIAGQVSGAVQQLLPEKVVFGGTSHISDSLYVPGVPAIVKIGGGSVGNVLSGTGSDQPTNYTITVKDTASIGQVITRSDAPTLTVVAAPPKPTGTRNVKITKPGQSIGDPASLKNLALAKNVGDIVVPPGT